MKLPRDLSGQALVVWLCDEWGYRKINQEGSHILIETFELLHQRLSVLAHKSLRIGTLNSILRAVSRHKGVSREIILQKFIRR